jgi:DNA primase
MNSIEEVKSRLNIEDVIGSYIELKRAGRNLKGCCPFHNEKTPSFVVSPEKQIAHCFGCHWGGDVIKFVQDYEKIEFPETLEMLAKRAGVTLPEKSFGGPNKSEQTLFKKMHRDTAIFFADQLQKNPTALKYLKDRDISDETIESFQLGWSPEDYHATHTHLEKKGYKKNDIVRAGIASKKNMADVEIFDRFRGRIIFPIWDATGSVIAFGGRVLKDAPDTAKYLNSPDTPIYRKGDHTYAFHHAKDSLRETEKAIVVEGYFDAITAHQAGFKNIVASLGTALTEKQLKLLQRHAKEILFSFDADNAGQSAAARSIALAQEMGCSIKIITMDSGKDPDECIRHDVENWKKSVEKSVPFMDYVISSALQKFGTDSIDGKKKVVESVLQNISNIPNAVEKEHYLHALARAVNTSALALTEELNKVLSGKKPHSHSLEKKPEIVATSEKKYNIENLILALLLDNHDLKTKFIEKLSEADFVEESAKSLYKAILAHYNLGDPSVPFESQCEAEKREKILILSLVGQEHYTAFSAQEKDKEIAFLIAKLKNRHSKSRIDELKSALKQAKNTQETQAILTELNDLIKTARN